VSVHVDNVAVCKVALLAKNLWWTVDTSTSWRYAGRILMSVRLQFHFAAKPDNFSMSDQYLVNYYHSFHLFICKVSFKWDDALINILFESRK
jgi:hypothetical protein